MVATIFICPVCSRSQNTYYGLFSGYNKIIYLVSLHYEVESQCEILDKTNLAFKGHCRCQ